jgi:hypothetical protein
MNLLSLPIEIQRLAQISDEEGLDSVIWPDYAALGIREEHIPALISILENIDDFLEMDGNEPAVFLPMHAGRILATLQVDHAIPLMISLLDRDDTESDQILSEELPTTLGRRGPAVFPPLHELLKDKKHGHWARLDAAEAMQVFAMKHPDYRSAVVSDLSDALAEYQTADPEMVIGDPQ